MYDIIIVGAGTAGLSAAIYGVRAGKKVLVLEQNSYGGQIVTSPEVENYPGVKSTSGYEFATMLYEQATELGAEIRFEQVEGLADEGENKRIYTDSGEYRGRTIILATGAKNRPLGLEKEEELVGRGVSYCAACDGAFFRGKNVAVVGGGNTAIEDAMYLSSYCLRVYMINRSDVFKGEVSLLEELEQKENVEIRYNSQVIRLQGEEALNAIFIKNDKAQEEELLVEGVFVAIGQMPENQKFAELVELDKKGYIKASEDCKTNVKGIFAAGDCRTKNVRQLTTAAADGAVAALAACEQV